MAKGLDTTFKVSLLAASVALASCSSDSDKRNEVLNKITSGGNFSINGGAAVDGDGGEGGEVYISWAGQGKLTISEKLQAPSVNASIPKDVEADFGSQSYYVGDDTEIVDISEPSGGVAVRALASAAPAEGVLYVSEGSLYVSDGDEDIADEAQVTGLDIDNGATVTFVFGVNETFELNLDSDIRNKGVITAEGGGINNILDIAANNYIGSKSSKINLSGVEAGDTARNLILNLSDSFYNQGEIIANGQSDLNADGGESGSIIIEADSDVYNSGNMQSIAGDSFETNPGGTAGVVFLVAEDGLLANAGNITVRPGVGSESERSDEASSIVLGGLSIANAGDLSAVGVASGAPNDAVDEADGLNGGVIVISAGENSIVNVGNINVNGASPTSNAEAYDGGRGGYVIVYSGIDGDSGDGIYFSGSIKANGAKGNTLGDGGEGGLFLLDGEGGNAELMLSGYGAISVNGGSSVNEQGGNGGYIGVSAESNIDILSTNFVAKAGGGGDSDAGYVIIDGGESGRMLTRIAEIPEPIEATIRSNINVDGGEGLVSLSNGLGDLTFVGDISANAQKQDEYGRDGGEVYLSGDSLNVKGSIKVNGSGGSLEGGYGGYIEFEFDDSISLNARLEAKGGNADASVEGSEGGGGGYIRLDDMAIADFSSHAVSYSLIGGTGEENGESGCIDFSDGVLPADGGCDK